MIFTKTYQDFLKHGVVSEDGGEMATWDAK